MMDSTNYKVSIHLEFIQNCVWYYWQSVVQRGSTHKQQGSIRLQKYFLASRLLSCIYCFLPQKYYFCNGAGICGKRSDTAYI